MSSSQNRTDLRGKRVTVMGLGIIGGGVGVATFLARHGAIVTVTDMRSADELASSIAALGDLPVTLHLGGHDLDDFRAAKVDMVVRNPGVPAESPYLEAAQRDGVPVEMEMSLFFQYCPAPIIGVTGTKGKTTVSALIGEMLRHHAPDPLIAGNMGVPALLEIDRLDTETPVVLELSSFQIEAMNDHQLAPHVSVLTNISEDHLDRYPSFDDYAQTKLGLCRYQGESDIVVYNADDPHLVDVPQISPARPMPVSIAPRPGSGAWLEGDELMVRWDGQTHRFTRPETLSLSGRHGALNTLLAGGAAVAYGVDGSAIAQGLESFAGVPHRLELVATIGGVRFVNDSSATAPAAAIAALNVYRTMGGVIHLIAGGANKNTDLGAFADAIVAAGARVYLLEGTASDALADGLWRHGISPVDRFTTMTSVAAAAAADARSGDVVALSPGCASFGLFRNEFDRGDQFRTWVEANR